MGDSSGNFKARGALLKCFVEYPQFKEDLEVLVAEGYVKKEYKREIIAIDGKTVRG